MFLASGQLASTAVPQREEYMFNRVPQQSVASPRRESGTQPTKGHISRAPSYPACMILPNRHETVIPGEIIPTRDDAYGRLQDHLQRGSGGGELQSGPRPPAWEGRVGKLHQGKRRVHYAWR